MQLAREEGVLIGPSGGAALAASLRLAAEIDRGIIVTVFPDGGDRYLSETFWSNAPAPRDSSSTRAGYVAQLGPNTYREIRAHGASTYPDECCGALLGPKQGDIVEAYRLPNEHDGEQRRRFLIGPNEYRLAEKRADETGQQLLGFYHSHPDHPAVPSAFDLEHAWPNMSYIIVSVKKGSPDEMRSWRLKADRSGYDEESLTHADQREN
jgi:proteasome lid subunit RPN8/RPN11